MIESLTLPEKTILANKVVGKIISDIDVDVHDGLDVVDCGGRYKDESRVCRGRGSR